MYEERGWELVYYICKNCERELAAPTSDIALLRNCPDCGIAMRIPPRRPGVSVVYLYRGLAVIGLLALLAAAATIVISVFLDELEDLWPLSILGVGVAIVFFFLSAVLYTLRDIAIALRIVGRGSKTNVPETEETKTDSD